MAGTECRHGIAGVQGITGVAAKRNIPKFRLFVSRGPLRHGAARDLLSAYALRTESAGGLQA